MEEYLIKNTTREQREQIVKDSLGYSELGCDDAMDGYDMQSVLETVPFFLQETSKYNLEIIIRTRENISELRRCSHGFFFSKSLKM